jgi:hypothetical protein
MPRNCRQVGSARRGAGSMPAACRISQTVEGATAMPSLSSSPWIRRWPHSGFSRARRNTSLLIPGVVGGRPGLRRSLVSYFFAANLQCQARSVAGVTGNTSAQRRRGTIRASAASQARSAGSYRTRPACLHSTAFSCRSTSTSVAAAWSPRDSTTIRRVSGSQHVDDLAQHPPTQPSPCPAVGDSAGQPRNRVFERHTIIRCR